MTEHRRFTLIELLIVISIIVILAAMLLPALSGTKEKSRRVLCLNNMKQMHIRATLWSNDHKNKLPKSSSAVSFIGQPGDQAMMALSGVEFVRRGSEPNSYDDLDGADVMLTCPSAPTPYIPWFHLNTRWVMAGNPQYLGGYDTTTWGSLKFDSPRKLTERPDSQVFSCRIESNDSATYFYHGPAGYGRFMGVFSDPMVGGGCQGTSIARLDGSSSFERKLIHYFKQKDLTIGRIYLARD